MSLHRFKIRLVAAFLFVVAPATAQEPAPLQFAVTYDEAITDSFSGRVYVMLSTGSPEPRFGPSWFNTQPFFAVDVEHWKPGTPLVFTDSILDCLVHLHLFTQMKGSSFMWAMEDSNLRPPACKAGALTS